MDAKERKKKVPRIHKSKSYLLPRSFEFHPCCEKNALAASFPPDALNVSNSSVVHRSMFALFTAEMCTPSDRCTPEQSRHTNTQNVFDVHFGLGVLQSKHSLFPFLRKSALNSASRSFCVAILLLLLLLELVSFSSFDVVYVCVCTRVFIMDDIDWKERIGLRQEVQSFYGLGFINFRVLLKPNPKHFSKRGELWDSRPFVFSILKRIGKKRVETLQRERERERPPSTGEKHGAPPFPPFDKSRFDAGSFPLVFSYYQRRRRSVSSLAKKREIPLGVCSRV